MNPLADWALLPQRAAVHLPTRTAVVADLHLGYDAARRSCGDAIPLRAADPWLPLASARERLSFDRLIVAGDLFERAFDYDLALRFRDYLASIGVELAAIVPGNHDRGWESFADRIPLAPDGANVGPWRVLHDDDGSDGLAVVGHVHPAWGSRGGRLPCFLASPRRIVLPAFSADAAGGNVAGDPRWRGYRVFVCEREGVHDAGAVGAKSKSPRRLPRGRTRRLGKP